MNVVVELKSLNPSDISLESNFQVTIGVRKRLTKNTRADGYTTQKEFTIRIKS